MKSAIIGIGASAGGLEAITELLSALPPRPGAAVVIVQHLDRNHDSLLSEILRRRTPIPVIPAEDGMETRPDHIYVIPPNVTLTVARGALVLEPRAPGPQVHKPVDALFRSLADECGDAAVGVVLSGADSDGANGIQAIKQAGGITFAQTPDTARVPSMPRSAIDTGCVDFVLPPSQIAGELARLAAHPYLQPLPADDPPALDVDESENLRRIFRRVRALHGVDFARYKSSTLRRRLGRRMAFQKVDTLAEYVELLEHDVAETSSLYQDFLIRVTSFFRDPAVFDSLSTQVFPRLAEGRAAKEPIRIWVPGCATGEEVYSIAMALVESMGDSAPPAGIQIFGTDVSESAVEKCRAGVYPETIATEVSAERLRRFFVRHDSNFVIARSIRDLCVFARHDITRDPPYSRLDLISCRNLLIYLGPAAQNRVMQVFRYALRAQGYLLLGPSEGVGHGEEFFESVDKEVRLFRPKGGFSQAALGFSLDRDGAGSAMPTPPAPRRGDQDFIESDAVQRQADRLLLARYAPAGILVDESLNILQFRGQTAPYLAPASGPPSLNLTRIVRPELMLAIPALVLEAKQSGRVVQRAGIEMDDVGAVDVELIPLAQTGGVSCFLILLTTQDAQKPRRDRPQRLEPKTNSEKDRRIAQVERENFELREFLQATMEHYEAAREELKSAHEEVLSANEEFQSTNEELETSKEELQSANEELTTTNNELWERNRLLAVLNAELEMARSASERARQYADGIVETVREPLVVLDGHLKVLRVNKSFCEEFSVRADAIEGRSLEIVSRTLWDESLNEKLGSILSANSALNDFEVIYNHPRLGTRVLCLNGRKIAGDAERGEMILLAIEDISDNRRRSDGLRDGSRRKDEFLAMLAHELRNPLGAISHAIEVLKRGARQDAPNMHLLIERQTARLVRLVNDLLDVARVSRGLIELKRAPIDLSQVVREAVDASRGKLEMQKHELTISLPDFPVPVSGDFVRLEQVVANLVENAIKYTERGGKITISLAEEGTEAVLRVADNGIGIDADHIREVFDLFTQVDSSPHRSWGGLGLGLSVVRRVMELHGGRIEVQSGGLGQGSEFTARLPLISPSALDPVVKAAPRVAAEAVPAKRVLIIDDSADSNDVMSLLVRQHGHETKTAATGADGVAAFRSFRPHIAFVDIGLPDFDGYEVARQIRASQGDPPAILVALTGYGTSDDRERAMSAGFDHHLIKPADAEQLARLLDS